MTLIKLKHLSLFSTGYIVCLERVAYFLRTPLINYVERVLGLLTIRPLEENHDFSIGPLTSIDSLDIVLPATSGGFKCSMFKARWGSSRTGVSRLRLPRPLGAVGFRIWSSYSRGASSFLLVCTLAQNVVPATNTIVICV